MKDNKKEQTIDNRFLARIIIEAATPLAVHSGEKVVQTDAIVIRDVNGLPYIPGSSIAGVIRHAWKDAGNDVNELFGFQKNPMLVEKEEPDGMGSRIIFSEARILNSKGQVVDGLKPDEIGKDPLLCQYADLPIRQHVRINHQGVTADSGKYDEQVVFAGTRFCFEIEMIGSEAETETFDQLLAILNQSTFRLGGGSRKGFGKIEVKEIRSYELSISDKQYLKKSSNMEDSKVWYNKEPLELKESKQHYLCYQLRPENFFLFGSGFGDDDADMTPVKEQRVTWVTGIGELTGYEYLIPATSVKGALAHRTAFHYNKIRTDEHGNPDPFFADDKTQEEIKAHTGTNNEAVRLLFGCEGDENGEGKQRGNVIISDMFVETAHDKILNHVAIDRFTGGAIDGALFSEKTAYWHSDNKDNYPLRLEILIDEKNIEKMDKNKIKENALKAFNMALNDLCNGLLPLGGGVNRGHGIFNGKKSN